MRPRRFRLNDAQQRWVRDWWRALQPRREDDPALPAALWAMGRGQRAQLRRCTDIEALLTEPASLLLAERLVALNQDAWGVADEPRSYERLAWVAGVLAQVRIDLADGKSLAWHLRQPVAGGTRPPMSELRFKALLRAAHPAALFPRWRRAVQQAAGQADVARLADDLLGWQIELNPCAARASQGVRFHWASDYYLDDRRAAAARLASDTETSA